MPRENTTKFAVLGILSMGPCSGYDIKKMSDMSISHFWSENYGHIYPVLRLLEAEGLVTRESAQTPGRPPKSVYRITREGSKALDDWLKMPVNHIPYRNELLLKLFFAQDVPVSHVIEMLQKEREIETQRMEVFRGIEETLRNHEPYKIQKALPLWLATLDYGKRSTKATIEWVDATIATLGS